jgi:WD40 repeat protein
MKNTIGEVGWSTMRKTSKRNYASTQELVSITCQQRNEYRSSTDELLLKLQQKLRKVARTYVACASDDQVFIYDVSLDYPIQTIECRAKAVSFFSENELVIAYDHATSNMLGLWNIQQNRFMKTTAHENNNVVTLVGIGQKVVINSGRGDVCIWDTTSNTVLFEATTSCTYDVQSFDQKMIDCNDNGEISLWSTDPLARTNTIDVDYTNIFSADQWSNTQIVAGVGRRIQFIDVDPFKCVDSYEVDGTISFIRKIDEDKIALLYMVDNAFHIYIWNARLKKIVKDKIAAGSSDSYRPFVIAKELLFYFDEENVVIFDTKTMKHVRIIQGSFNTNVCVTAW